MIVEATPRGRLRASRVPYVRFTDPRIPSLPEFPFPNKAPEMDKAIQTARDSVDTFIAALKSPAPGRVSFTVKKPFKDGGQVEHIWLSNASFDGTRFSGRVDNEPADVKNVRFGQIATAGKDEISDWFYIENGKLVGGYTIRVLYSQMSPAEKKDFDAHAASSFSDRSFRPAVERDEVFHFRGG